jgi:hypothetical protein
MVIAGKSNKIIECIKQTSGSAVITGAGTHSGDDERERGEESFPGRSLRGGGRNFRAADLVPVIFEISLTIGKF